jgi:serine protease Do
MSRWPIALVCVVLGGLMVGLISNTGLHGQLSSPPAVPKEMTSYRDIVKKVLPAVVEVRSIPKLTAKTKQDTPRRRLLVPEEFRKFFEDMQEPGVFDPSDILPPQKAYGSGFIVDPKGIVLTNYHVVEGADRVEITFKDGHKVVSKDIHGDRKNDLAIVRLDAQSALAYLKFGDSDAMEIGDRVLAVGAPFELQGSVTAGIVSAKGRNGLTPSRAVYEDYLQTDAAINPGNSGGPLVNLAGEVIGINTAIRSRTGGFQGVGLAIASNVAKNIVDQLINNGTVRRGYLGVQVGELKPEVAAQLGVKGHVGVVVSRVYEKTPAAKAGIEEGDVILSVAGKEVRDARELQRIIGSAPIQKPIPVKIVRDGNAKDLSATIEEQPENYGLVSSNSELGRPPQGGDKEDMSVEKVGIDFTDLSPEIAGKYGHKESAKGVVITDVQPGSLAAEAGLRRGTLIVKIDKKPVSNAAAARDVLDKASLEKGVLLQVQNPPPLGGTAYIMLKSESGV